jgi:hypothetical protein
MIARYAAIICFYNFIPINNLILIYLRETRFTCDFGLLSG